MGKVTRRRLKTLIDVRRYLADLINQTRSGEVEPSLAGKLGFLLNILRATILDGEIEDRIKKLENHVFGGE